MGYHSLLNLYLLYLLLQLLITACVMTAVTSESARDDDDKKSSNLKRRTYIFRVSAESKPSIFPTHYNWYQTQFLINNNNNNNNNRIVHVYDTAFHGFSAVMRPREAAELVSRNRGVVLAAFKDRRRQLHTTRSPQFLGLRNQHGLWSLSDYGSDVIIGVFDTGIFPQRRSFSDLNLPPSPPAGRVPARKSCNKKIVGARFFAKGHEAATRFGIGIGGGINQTVEFMSPRDADGHGTHTASTAAGRHSFRATMSGYASGIAKGVAPKARLAVYKVCWKNSGCFDSDILAAFDAAVKDGVDVISISIGGGDGGISSPYYLDPIAIGSYGAASRGIFISSSAGNDGPNGMSVTNLAPWMTTVGAGTIDRNFPADVVLGNGRKFSGVSLYAGAPLKKAYPLVYPGGKEGTLSASLCMEGSLDPNAVRGKIVICDRGSNPRVAKGMVVKKAGGVGMILSNGASNGEGLVGDAHLIPTCAVGADEGDAIKSYVTTTVLPTATMYFRGTIIGIKPAPVVASFSGRGPNGLNPEILKPDLIAPGVNILAAWTDAVGPTGLDSDKRRTEFNILSGTSMAAPHVSGAAALLKSAHPGWSPAAIRSAMMTTASVTDNRFGPMTDEASGKASTPYDYGSGHVNLDLGMDPGLVYDITNNDYILFLCSIGYGPKTIQVITRSPVGCPIRKKPLAENLNYPSMTATFSRSSNKAAESKTFIRSATNVGAAASVVYKAKVEAPKGTTVTVKPTVLAFSEGVRKLSYAVTVTVDIDRKKKNNLELGEAGAVFGAISWLDGKHVVRSPIVVTLTDPL